MHIHKANGEIRLSRREMQYWNADPNAQRFRPEVEATALLMLDKAPGHNAIKIVAPMGAVIHTYERTVS